MRILALSCVLILGACAADPAAYDARCMRLQVPENFDDKSRTQASGATPIGTGALPEQVSDGKLEVNCGEGSFRVNDADTSGEPNPL